MQFYTGVGSRKTPADILTFMTEMAEILCRNDMVLRSGGADGADNAFEAGATLKQIYYANMATPAAMEIAAQFHPVWNRLSPYVRKLHGRNAFQVLGLDLDSPSEFLICWTPDACECHADRSIRTGGTGTAISIAEHYNVPVFNLANPKSLAYIKSEVYA